MAKRSAKRLPAQKESPHPGEDASPEILADQCQTYFADTVNITKDLERPDSYVDIISGCMASGEWERAEGYLQEYFRRFQFPSLEAILYRVPHIDISGDVKVKLSLEGRQIVCENDDLRIYGMGATLAEAYEDFCEDFVVLYQEYVVSDDELAPSGQKLAETLKRMVGK